MPISPTTFEFTSYSADLAKRLLTFTYTINFSNREPLVFTEKLILPADQKIAANIPPQLLESVIQGLHLMMGISYYKLYCPNTITLTQPLAPEQALFWNKVYRKGLGEFLYRNNLDPAILAKFPETAPTADGSGLRPRTASVGVDFARTNRSLLGIGGGKDSLVAAELLKEQKLPASTLVTETQRQNAQTRSVVKAIGLPSIFISRQLDPKIFEKYPDSFNGHIPISAILAWIGILAGVLYDYRYAIVANEYSSNFGNLEYKGELINHQWSKSAEFEELFQEYIRRFVTPDITYFSILRPFYELRIAKLFSRHAKYFRKFSSCNQVAKINPSVILSEAKNLGREYAPASGEIPRLRDDSRKLWCNQCSKCAFVFAILAPFVSKKDLVSIFGKNLFEDEALIPIYKDLVGLGTLKPFDCVGTFEEIQAALHLCKKRYGKTIVFKTLSLQLTTTPEAIAGIMRTQPSPLVPAPFRFSGMTNALILGYGKEGTVSYKYMRKRYPKLKLGIADERKNKNYLEIQQKYDVAIKTPGIPKRFVNIPYTTATNLFFSQTRSHLTIGVTGTKGKSTTSSLIYAILKEAGKPVQLLGNIGVPMLGALISNLSKLLSDKTIFVLELSSHQLDDTKYSPNIAVVTNLFPEHLPYHEGAQPYYRAKRNIVEFQSQNDSFIFNPNDPQLVEWAGTTRSKAIPFAADIPVTAGEMPLLGPHNLENVCAAVTVARLLKIPDEVSRRAILNFKPLPHRLENICTFRGITFYDDAISTAPESTIMALRSLPKIGTIFLGGLDRGYDFTGLEAAVRTAGIKNIVLFPDTGERMFTGASELNILRTRSMRDAVQFAYDHTEPGEICLLSTASPSYSLWKDFNEKGNEFQKYAKKLGKQ